MNILYLANIRFPTEKAHGVQIAKTCEALAKAGAALELCVTNRRTPIAAGAFAYYGVAAHFALMRLPVIDLVAWGRIGFWLETLSFSRAAQKHIRTRAPDVVFCRDEAVLARLQTGARLVWETHTGSWDRSARAVAARAHRIIAISQGLKDFYVARGVPADKITVAHDGVDIAQFEVQESKEEARKKLGLDPGRTIALYTGSTYVRKGVQTFKEAQDFLADVEVHIVSGKPYADMPLYLRAADVLVLPTSGRDEVSRAFTSPMKLFEYMAAGKPIVASDLPSTREILSEDEAYFFAPDDAKSLARAVRQALSDPAAPARAARAQELAKRYTWDARACAVLAAIS